MRTEKVKLSGTHFFLRTEKCLFSNTHEPQQNSLATHNFPHIFASSKRQEDIEKLAESGSFHSAIRKFTPKNSKGESRSLPIMKYINLRILTKQSTTLGAR